jgi:hypothetical protein
VSSWSPIISISIASPRDRMRRARVRRRCPDGIIAHALDTIERADRIGKARDFVGVETSGVSEGVPSKVTLPASHCWK